MRVLTAPRTAPVLTKSRLRMNAPPYDIFGTFEIDDNTNTVRTLRFTNPLKFPILSRSISVALKHPDAGWDVAERPTLAEFRERLHRRKPISAHVDTAHLVREEREAR